MTGPQPDREGFGSGLLIPAFHWSSRAPVFRLHGDTVVLPPGQPAI